jgi:hypothetical protein
MTNFNLNSKLNFQLEISKFDLKLKWYLNLQHDSTT